MIVKALSSTIIGIESHSVRVEVDLAPGLPLFSTVGLPDVAVRESKDRIKAAIKNSGYAFPGHHVTVNLAPADIKKEGTAFDLPIAVALWPPRTFPPLADRLSPARRTFADACERSRHCRALANIGFEIIITVCRVDGEY